MRILKYLLLIILPLLSSCAIISGSIDDKYQPLGTAVLTANDLLVVKYYQEHFDSFSGEEYKALLKEKYMNLYQNISPYSVNLTKADPLFKVTVKDGDLLILIDWLCTENRIDCWSYNLECSPDTLIIDCDSL